MYQNIKKSPNMFSFQCKKCENLLPNLPFFNDDEQNHTNFETFENVPLNENTDEYINDDDQYQHFKKGGLHFIHLNINSVLSKIDQLRIIALKTNAAVIGLTESKLDEAVADKEILVNGYKLLRSDRNRQGGGVACYVRTDLFFNKRENFSTETENLFFDIFLPKTKPILVGILYRPPDQSGFLKNLSNSITNTENFDNQEVYILGDLNINLLYKEKRLPNGIKAYKEFCAVHGLTQIINKPTRITENTSTLLDHILTNSTEKNSQFGVLDIGLSDHQIFFAHEKQKN